eukprot:TRINITY_DN2331_c0_g1::TRINITY_DN2331_c0_g1_i1::g.20780::m.20780 TRINITY_DN2331_c0_g1::TRINITY_DN2331_c0_g1_i1::g.20780  ORF type:complete len:627 (-),score=217.77,sp/Q38950/2AAB_ARATH/51.82/0.0,HEAT/PF02985.17/1.9e+03,HEAT/PF02985.17/1.9e+03,HEAT/PF02985.17/0.0035,HEAT/PF02985.17/1.1e-05,HEAT/PF02985.17/0.28,HEAT/PF02985.17/0.59,HEAT/PF02985.17/0.013,HEAT/PF02985.17/1,HEAT/PF02985.17/0.01,HEAT/PF02985.17/0.05,HEAT/PF02985.17/9.4,HEAT/PF02985.17/0.27,HEAT/PF02985.17/0.0052,HEAT/PF02985.17/0.18,HE
MANIDLMPIAILIDELGHEDLQVRLNSIKKLDWIAAALGPERTRKELVPFLAEKIDDEDEVLLALAEELGKLVPLVGGPAYAGVLMPPLCELCTVEETVVREKAVESLCVIADQMENHANGDFFNSVKKLSEGEGWFTNKISAAGLLPTAYKHATDATNRLVLRNIFEKLCQDDTPMVRRAAAQNLGRFAREVDRFEKSEVQKQLLPLFFSLGEDEQDSVRILAVENCADMAAILRVIPDAREKMIAVVRSFASDKSWRVRYMFAQQLVKLATAFNDGAVTKDVLLPAYNRLLRDTEAEVRTCAASKVAEFCEKAKDILSLASPDLVLLLKSSDLLSAIAELSRDQNQHVRAALASVVMELSPLFGSDESVRSLLPLFLQLLQDDFSEVRLNIISKLDKVSQTIGVDKLTSQLLPAIVGLADDKQWRVRLAIIQYIPLLATQLGVDFFVSNDTLFNLCVTWLGDCVCAIREAATQNLKNLTEVFGAAWAKEHVIPFVLKQKSHPNYLHRMTTLNAVGELVPVLAREQLGAEIISESLLSVLLDSCKDPVANIRFNAARALSRIHKNLDRMVVDSKVVPRLRELCNDDDMDVKFFAHEALTSCG